MSATRSSYETMSTTIGAELILSVSWPGRVGYKKWLWNNFDDDRDRADLVSELTWAYRVGYKKRLSNHVADGERVEIPQKLIKMILWKLVAIRAFARDGGDMSNYGFTNIQNTRLPELAKGWAVERSIDKICPPLSSNHIRWLVYKAYSQITIGWSVFGLVKCDEIVSRFCVKCQLLLPKVPAAVQTNHP